MKFLKSALSMFFLMTLLTGIIYPLFILLIAQLTMPSQSNGSLLKINNRIIGSTLIAQKTDSDDYFWPRPSAIDYDPTKPSGGSNLGPTSKKLKDQVVQRAQKLGKGAPHELLYASGSGLDPHISLETAYFQMERVAKARSLNGEELKQIIETLKERQSIFGKSHYVNVLLLNQALDAKRRK